MRWGQHTGYEKIRGGSDPKETGYWCVRGDALVNAAAR